MVICSHLDLSILLLPLPPPFLILRVTFDPLEEGSTDKGYVLADSIVLDPSPSVQMHRSAKEMGGV